jgi:hypothetical protein
MLDWPEDVCPGQVWFEYPATSVPFSNLASLLRMNTDPSGDNALVADLPDATVASAEGSEVNSLGSSNRHAWPDPSSIAAENAA